MTIEDNKAIIKDYIDRLFSEGDLTAVDDYLAEDYVDHDPPFGSEAPAQEAMLQAARTMRAGFPDWRSQVHRLVGEGDIVVEHFTASGTHQHAVMGVPATGRTISLHGMQIFRLRDGRIVERWAQIDFAGFAAQLGAVPVQA
jgi:steroid delta-isomerase-like uncharacterized protein